MRKWLLLGIILSCSVLDSTEMFAEEKTTVEDHAYVQIEELNTGTKQVTKDFIGRGNVENERSRQLRRQRYSPLQAVGLYAHEGDQLMVRVTGQDSLTLVIGTPERNTQRRVSLNQGENEVSVDTEGAIYIINPNEQGSSTVTIAGATGNMPFFDLATTSVAAFNQQMDRQRDAKDVQLISEKAIITVSYDRARRFIEDPKVLMEYYDHFLLAQDWISGIRDDGNPANFTDRNFQHFIETSRLYMFATQEHMGFTGDAALARLLRTNNGWGPWHESGHQRQQAPWTWGSVVEGTVNIYSMAAQKAVTGSITAMDQYYPEMHRYLNSGNKDFERQNNNLKMVMFGQLWNTFGDEFYPILHQYYRENNLNYGSDAERIQNFVINVSAITGYNMVPYFEQWGFSVTESTRQATRLLVDLPEKIWLNDHQTNKRLPMRLLNGVNISRGHISVDLTEFANDIYQGQKIVLIKNGQYVSELTNKRPFYSFLNRNVWRTNIDVEPHDEIRIETRNSNGTFEIYRGSIIVDQLKKELHEYLGSAKNLHSLLTQQKLNDYRQDINALTDTISKEKLLVILEKVEQRYLESLVSDVQMQDRDNGTLRIEFANSSFREYTKIVAVGDNRYLGEISNGRPAYGSLSRNVFFITQQGQREQFEIQFRLPHKTYIVGIRTQKELQLRNEIDRLFTANNQLNPEITQERLDQLRTTINEQAGETKGLLVERLNHAQQLFFEALISDISLINNRLTVTFANDLFRNYRIVTVENDQYQAEIANGRPYYGGLNGHIFTVSRTSSASSSHRIEFRHSSGTYRINRE